MSILDLQHDAWAVLGRYLDPISLYNLPSSCMGLCRDVTSNNALWHQQAAKRWPDLSSTYSMLDWHAVYKAAHKAAHKLATLQPWTANMSNKPRDSTPRSARLLVLHGVSAIDSSSSSSSSSKATASSSLSAGTAWEGTTCVAAAVASRMHWWLWTAQADRDAPFVGPCMDTRGGDDAIVGTDMDQAGLAAAAAHQAASGARYWYSDVQHGHKGAVSALIAVPTGAKTPGFATGSNDATIKLWMPLTSSSTGGVVRPVRSLTGHTSAITSLVCCHQQAAGIGDSSSGSGPFLASASADRTIKLWSLSSMQQTSGANRAPTPTHSSRGLNSGSTPMASGTASAIRQGQHRQQMSRNPLLGTLRGHASAVTCLLPWPAAQTAEATCEDITGTYRSFSGLLSGSNDCRVKLWDIAEARRTCVASWGVPWRCTQLLDGFDIPGCAVVLMPGVVQVIDTRIGSSTTGAKATTELTWAGKGPTAAAVHGSMVAAGGRDGVRVWDLRMRSTSGSTVAATDSSSSSGGSRVLLSGHLPGKVPVSYVHLDSQKLVAASSRAQLHSAAGLGVWSMLDGNRVSLPSSCLSAINLQPSRHPDRAAALALDCSLVEGHEALSQLIHSLPARQGVEAAALFRGDDNGAAGGGFDSDFDDDDIWMAAAFDAAYSETSDTSSEAGSNSSGLEQQAEPEDYGSVEVNAGIGCIEPGLLAMAAHGPVLACIDSQGHLLVRDFTSGLPCQQLIKQYTVVEAGKDAAGVACSVSNQAGEAALRPAQEHGTQGTAGAGKLGDATEQLAGLRFWRT